MVAAAAIPLAGKLLPFLLKAGSAAKLPAGLRTAGAVGGGLPSFPAIIIGSLNPPP